MKTWCKHIKWDKICEWFEYRPSNLDYPMQAPNNWNCCPICMKKRPKK